MQDYFYIKEKLDKFNFSERLARLSKKFKKKKIVIFGLNNSFKLLNSEYDIESYFNIIAITDFHLQIPEEDTNFKLIHIDNLYFSGADVIINFKEDGRQIEKYLRHNRLIKKKIKFINIIDKSFINKCTDNINLVKKIFTTYSKTKKIVPIVKDLINYDFDNIISRLNYKEKIANLCSNSTEPIRVMFFVFNYRQWTLSNLYFELRANKNFKILPIVVLPSALTNREYNSVEETLTYFQNKGYQCIEGVEKDTGKAVIIKALKPDIIFYQQPEYLKDEYSPEALSNYAITCYIEPDFFVDKQNSEINAFIDNQLNNTCKLYTSNRYSLKNYKHTSISGCMLFEKYKQNTTGIPNNKWLNNNENQFHKIIYSPSLIINNNCNKTDFLEYQKSIFLFITSHLHYHFVTLPHKNLKKQCIDNDVFSEDEFNAFMTNFSVFQDIPYNTNIDSVDLYKISDLLITDNISSAIEYFPTGKPIIYIDKGQINNLNDVGKKIFKTFYVVTSVETMSIVLEDLLSANNDYNLKKRYSLIGKYSEYFNPKASEYIKNDLMNILNRSSIVDNDVENQPQETDDSRQLEEVKY